MRPALADITPQVESKGHDEKHKVEVTNEDEKEDDHGDL